MAHIGEYVHEKAEIRVLVGFVRAGGEPEEPNFSHDWSDTYTNEGKRFEYHWLFIHQIILFEISSFRNLVIQKISITTSYSLVYF